MASLERLDRIVRERAAETRERRQQTRADVSRKVPLQAEPDEDRTRRYAFRRRAGAEALQGDSVDYLPSWFLELGAERARAVALVRAADIARGTGFLISPRLFITNNHVLENRAEAGQFSLVFNYELDSADHYEATSVFTLDPDSFWLTSGIDELDFTIVAVGPRIEGTRELAGFGCLPLSDSPDRHALGMCVNIIQHPLGKRKQVVVRENRLLARGAAQRVLHYSADTEEGSSGSPVFNDDWEVVALHHWGVPHLDTVTIDGEAVPQTVNEGVRASSIVAQLKAASAGLEAAPAALLAEALALGSRQAESLPRQPVQQAAAGIAPPIRPMQETPPMSSASGIVQILNIPLEISIRLAGGAPFESVRLQAPVSAPGSAAAAPFALSERLVVDRDYANRKGYEAGFLEGLELKLADFVKPRAAEIAPLLDGRSGLDAVLDYEHFSLIMSAPRKLALMTATNIDAAHYLEIDRDTGLPRLGPEGDTWVDDPRLATGFRIGQDFYSAWSSLFDRGHLTRRTDPTWGTPEQAVRANADTFHRTNCSPQHFRFNESIRYWQGVERYVLEFGALKDKRRVSVFTGPVLNDDHQDFGGLAVPLKFWKLVLRLDHEGKPQATALVVDQRRLLGEKRVPIRPGGDGTPPDVSEYRVSVSYLESLAGLDFSAVRAFDSYRAPAALSGAEAASARVISDWSDLL